MPEMWVMLFMLIGLVHQMFLCSEEDKEPKKSI